ncbi:MAG TPA: hypothetical protein VHB21_25045 [Minicystis sp.]|nr:hypothetical protein [Minicystis sp.]
MASDRMFQVLVLGGAALVGAACGGRVVVDGTLSGGVGGATGTGGTTSTVSHDATGMGAFPSEGPASSVVASSSSGFPQETGMAPDAGSDAGFPQETNIPADAGSPMDAGFPQETAAP